MGSLAVLVEVDLHDFHCSSLGNVVVIVIITVVIVIVVVIVVIVVAIVVADLHTSNHAGRLLGPILAESSFSQLP